MLGSDLAKLYECTNGTKDINKAVNRNKEKFPNDFYFQLNKVEYEEVLRFQNGTLKTNRGEHRKYLPYVFTEEGVAMLSSVLKTEIASKVSISIMRSFVAMRKYISSNLLISKKYSDMLIDHEGRIKILENSFSKFDTFSNEIFFEGQIYDAYSLLLDIINTSKKSIIIIDNYISKELLDVLSKTNKEITIYSKNMDNTLINKYKI